ncbi:MAG: hypothetical protein WAO56_07435 [Miniphocaeibacter sp.]|uniref:hypothetical protein n=1 Tax=Miniphocaeibacter sp. TaxID=3100973 RepID=UPI001852A34D|nr:hypothetical protein [Gallicola sp.]
MNKLLRVMFIILMIALLGAAIMQIFFPEAMGANSEYGVSVGWQREIGFWNLAILPILIGVNRKYDLYFLTIVVLSLIVGGLGFGTNHLIGYINDSSKVISLIGALENYAFVILWIIGLKIEYKIQKTQTGNKHD